MSKFRNVARRGFTLVELLVVVAIIAVLVAILLPSLSESRQTAVRAVCQTRLKAIGLATQNYLTEFDATFPINGMMFPKSGMPQAHSGDPVFQLAEAPIAQGWLPMGFPNLAGDAVNGTGLWRLEFGVLYHEMGGAEFSRMDIPTLNSIAGGTPLPATPNAIAKTFLCPDDVVKDRTYLPPAGAGNSYGVHPLILRVPPAGTNPLVYECDGSTPDRTVPQAPGYWSYSVNSVLNSLGRFRDNFTNPPAAWGISAIPIPWPDPIKMGSIRTPSMFVAFVEEGNGSLFNDEVFDAPAFNGGDKLTDRHIKGGNVSFLDGHTEPFNEVQFDQVPQGSSGFQTALQSPITAMFFPDRGDFANALP